jgi:hypothetical protein
VPEQIKPLAVDSSKIFGGVAEVFVVPRQDPTFKSAGVHDP